MNSWIKGMIAVFCSAGAPLLPAGTEAATHLDELEAVVVYGQKFEERVLDSETRFYSLYNTLNANDQFDVSCDYYWWEDRSMMVFGPGVARRGCVPMYFVEAVADRVSWEGAMHRCSGPSADFGGSIRVQYEDGGAVGYVPMAGMRSTPTSGSCSALYAPIPPDAQLIYLSRRAEFVANLARVMRSDADLQVLAFEADSLAGEGKAHLTAAAEARRQIIGERKCVPAGSPRGGMHCAPR